MVLLVVFLWPLFVHLLERLPENMLLLSACRQMQEFMQFSKISNPPFQFLSSKILDKRMFECWVTCGRQEYMWFNALRYTSNVCEDFSLSTTSSFDQFRSTPFSTVEKKTVNQLVCSTLLVSRLIRQIDKYFITFEISHEII